MNVLIVGAGVMGMMLARELSQSGVDVSLVDKNLAGSEASWAGGGIVSPLYPWRYNEAVTQLASWSQSYYPNLIQSLEAESGIDPELTRHGMLMLNVNDRERALSWSEAMQPSWLEQIQSDQLYQLEPHLREGLENAFWMPLIASVRNPRLLRALGKIISNDPNITLYERKNVQALINHNGAAKGIETEEGERLMADKVVLCSGAWTGDLLKSFGLNDLAIDVHPVKGQMILFDAKPGLVNRVVLSNGKYVIPRRDGQVLAGSTLEYSGYDKTTDEQAKQILSDQAIDLYPELANCRISHHWAGLRPGSPDGIPFIGKIPGVDSLYVNAGQFRNGLVLAPASVRLMSSMLLGQEPPFDPSAYQPRLLDI